MNAGVQQRPVRRHDDPADAAAFYGLLEGMASDPGLPISRLPMLTEGERKQLLVEWNDTAGEYPSDRCVHQLFEEQVERTPDAVPSCMKIRA